MPAAIAERAKGGKSTGLSATFEQLRALEKGHPKFPKYSMSYQARDHDASLGAYVHFWRVQSSVPAANALIAPRRRSFLWHEILPNLHGGEPKDLIHYFLWRDIPFARGAHLANVLPLWRNKTIFLYLDVGTHIFPRQPISLLYKDKPFDFPLRSLEPYLHTSWLWSDPLYKKLLDYSWNRPVTGDYYPLQINSKLRQGALFNDFFFLFHCRLLFAHHFWVRDFKPMHFYFSE